MVLVDYVLWRDPVGAGLDGYRDSVLIGTADEQDVLSLHPQVPDIDVGGDVDPGKVSDVYRTVGIRKRAGHKCPFEFFHILYSLSFQN